MTTVTLLQTSVWGRSWAPITKAGTTISTPCWFRYVDKFCLSYDPLHHAKYDSDGKTEPIAKYDSDGNTEPIAKYDSKGNAEPIAK